MKTGDSQDSEDWEPLYQCIKCMGLFYIVYEAGYNPKTREYSCPFCKCIVPEDEE